MGLYVLVAVFRPRYELQKRRQEMRKTVFVLLMVVVVLSGVAYTAEKTMPTTCKQCNKKIAEPDIKFAVYIPGGIEPSSFDDIGCAVVWYNTECAMRQSAFDNYAIVHDYVTGAPIPVEKATYVSSPDVKTPKGYGIVAFATKDEARKFADKQESARVLNYQDVTSLKLE